jgi:hypothetical protein
VSRVTKEKIMVERIVSLVCLVRRRKQEMKTIEEIDKGEKTSIYSYEWLEGMKIGLCIASPV